MHVHPYWGNLPKLLSKSWDTFEPLVLATFENPKTRPLHLASASRLAQLSIVRNKMSKAYPPHEFVSILREYGNPRRLLLTTGRLMFILNEPQANSSPSPERFETPYSCTYMFGKQAVIEGEILPCSGLRRELVEHGRQSVWILSCAGVDQT